MTDAPSKPAQIIRGGRSLGVRFDVLPAIIPPEGSKVRPAYHKASRSDSKSLFENYPFARLSEAFEGKEATKMGLKA
ncbi:MAG TPA: hypothetical protein HPP90_05535 [Deltaproteobacteria bacterium]|nr:hypothetical protein [Deltaproteobacteria bacterium]